MRNNYRHIPTGKIAEYNSAMNLWNVGGEYKIYLASWQFEHSKDWEEIIPIIKTEPIFTLAEIYKAMLIVSNHPVNYIGEHKNLINYLEKLKYVN